MRFNPLALLAIATTLACGCPLAAPSATDLGIGCGADNDCPADARCEEGTCLRAARGDSGVFDAGADAGLQVDAGADAGLQVDAGAEVDAGADVDAGAEVDAGADVDAGVPADWFDVRWRFRVRIDIANPANADEVNIPVVVRVASSALLPGVPAAGGADLRFVDTTGQAWDHEIERYVADGLSVLWLRVPALPADGASVYLYYGNPDAQDVQNPAGVWSNEYVGVWHLSDVPTGAPADIQGSVGADGSSQGDMGAGDAVDGVAGGALQFDGANDHVHAPAYEGPVSALTLQVWMRPRAALDSGDSRMDLMYSSTNGRPHLTFNREGDGRFALHIHVDGAGFDDVRTDATSWTAGAWVQLAFTWDGVVWTPYVNGAQGGAQVSHAGTHVASPQLFIGATKSPSNFFDGALDEARVSRVARSPGWVRIQHDAMRSSITTLQAPDEL